MNRVFFLIALIAVLYALRNHLPIPLFRLPGDINIRSERLQLFIPVTSCLIVSIAASIFFSLLGLLQRH